MEVNGSCQQNFVSQLLCVHIVNVYVGKGKLFEKRYRSKEKLVSTLLIGALLAVLLIPSLVPLNAFSTQPPVDTTTYYMGTMGQPSRTDPARAYDQTSGELLQNVYQTLIWFSDKNPVTFTPGVGYNLTVADYSNLDQYGPVLATEVPTEANGRIVVNSSGSYWRFTINTAATFQPWVDSTGATRPSRAITAADVVYSFQRQVIYDSPYGPTWMWMMPAFGIPCWADSIGGQYATYPNGTFMHAMEELIVATKITQWCYSIGNDVYFHFQIPWAETVMRQIFAQTWGSIVNPDWVREYGGWDGSRLVYGWTNDYHWKPTATQSELDTYKDPAIYGAKGSKYSSFKYAMSGTGPYTFTSWDTTKKIWRIDIFQAYWKGWAQAGDKDGNRLQAVIWKGVDAWPTRKMSFLEGEFDVCSVPRNNMFDLLTSTYNPISSVNLVYNIQPLRNEAVLFTLNVSSASPYQSYVGYPTHLTSAEPLFFENENMRRAFAWALNYTEYIQLAYSGEAIKQTSWWEDDPSLRQRDLNYTEMQNELNQAVIDGYNVSEQGFETVLLYNVGSEPRRIALQMIRDAFQTLNSNYKCNVVGLNESLFVDAQNNRYLPGYCQGKLADYADPTYFARVYMYSKGYFPIYQGPPFPTDQELIDTLIDAASVETDRTQFNILVKDLQKRYYDDVISFGLVRPLERRWQRDWVQGWYYNALFPGEYAYDLYKSTTTLQNVDVDMTATVTPAVPTYNPVYIFHTQMRKGNGDASAASMAYTLHVKRNDANGAITTLYAAVGLTRTSPTGDKQFANGTYVALLAGGDASVTVTWWEDGTNQIMAGNKTGIPYAVAGETAVMNANAQDSNTANNVQAAGTLFAKTLISDITGNGFVDIFDAIQLATACWTAPGDKKWNANADLNGSDYIDIYDAILLAADFNKHVP